MFGWLDSLVDRLAEILIAEPRTATGTAWPDGFQKMTSDQQREWCNAKNMEGQGRRAKELDMPPILGGPASSDVEGAHQCPVCKVFWLTDRPIPAPVPPSCPGIMHDGYSERATCYHCGGSWSGRRRSPQEADAAYQASIGQLASAGTCCMPSRQQAEVDYGWPRVYVGDQKGA